MTTVGVASSPRSGADRDDIRFWKMQGAGNDFVVLDLTTTPAPTPALCAFLSDRNTGVGCDLILGVGPPRTSNAVATYTIWTSTGARSSQCGNGARCVASWLKKRGWVKTRQFRIDSPSSTHDVRLHHDGSVSVELGVPVLDPPRRVRTDGIGGDLELTPVWMGNPHAVIGVADASAVPLADIGRAVQASATFDPQTNVGVVERVDRSHIELRVFEFGAGETLACGSGACAAVATLRRQGVVDSEVVVSQRGGDLRIRWLDDGDQMVMTGPATSVFHGTICAADLRGIA